MFKVLVSVAIAASQVTSGAARECGWLEDQCCPGEICLRERSVCFWGTCKPCGGDGNPVCKSGDECDWGNKAKDGWCVHDNEAGPTRGADPTTPPPPSDECGWENEDCCADDVCEQDRTACWEGTCMPCGGDGKPVCPIGDLCDAGNRDKDDFCVRDNGSNDNDNEGNEGDEGQEGDEGDEGKVTEEFLKITTEDFVCIAQTVTEEVASTRDFAVHSEAIATAFSTACAKGDDVTVEDFDNVFRSADAFVFAATMAKVQLNCFSFTEAYACVSVTAAAEAWAEATAAVHAQAVSAAVSGCGCLTESVTAAFADASLYLKLIAEAASTATATVCQDGDGFVKAGAYDSCLTQVYGKIFAEATAEAIAEGDCLSAQAISTVLADAGAHFDAFSTCGGDANVMEAEPEVVEKEVAKAEALRADRRK